MNHRSDTVAQYLVRGVFRLLGIKPKDAVGVVAAALEAQGAVFCSRFRVLGNDTSDGHEDGVEVGLAGLGFTGDGNQFAAGETGRAVPVEKELVRRNFGRR